DPFNRTWRLRPLSPTRFRAPDSPIDKSTLVFEQTNADAPVTLRMEVDDGSTLEFERVTLVEPGGKELADCAGVYYNDEVQATYRFFVRDGALFLQVNNRRHERLEPTLRDTYIASVRQPDDNRIITFVRDDEKRVTAFTIDLWRVKGLR